MAQEIERKFLVKGDFKSHATSSEAIVQGYLSSAPERNVRVRIKGDKAYLTVKGIGDESGISRFEWEKEIGCQGPA
jgi:adenylate cyclase